MESYPGGDASYPGLRDFWKCLHPMSAKRRHNHYSKKNDVNTDFALSFNSGNLPDNFAELVLKYLEKVRKMKTIDQHELEGCPGRVGPAQIPEMSTIANLKYL